MLILCGYQPVNQHDQHPNDARPLTCRPHGMPPTPCPPSTPPSSHWDGVSGASRSGRRARASCLCAEAYHPPPSARQSSSGVGDRSVSDTAVGDRSVSDGAVSQSLNAAWHGYSHSERPIGWRSRRCRALLTSYDSLPELRCEAARSRVRSRGRVVVRSGGCGVVGSWGRAGVRSCGRGVVTD